nr:PAB-dependent poly(A)-specific ribonuclease subunit PAN2 [Cryptococcus depauperatus CBS 7855]
MNYNPLYLLSIPPTPLDAKPYPTALSVDPFSNVLWVGSSSGLVSALCSPLALTRNVQFPAHGYKSAGAFGQQGSAAVRELRVTDRDVWTLTEGGVGGRRRGGMTKWTVSDPIRSLRTMSPNPTNSHELLAGGTGSLLLANTARGEVIRRIDHNTAVIKLAPLHRTVLAAGLSGQITVLDPRTGFKAAQNVNPAQAHTGGLSGADVQGNIIATWGWTHMQGHPLPDPLIRLYDVRALRPLPPISFPSGPAFVLLHPSSSSHIVVSSQQGMLQNIDMSLGPSATVFQQLDVATYVTSMTLSNRGDYLAAGDADGKLHLCTTHEIGENAVLDDSGNIDLPPFNGYDGTKPEWPDPTNPPAQINWQDTTPLNLIGMPYYTEPLLSQIPNSCYAHSSSPLYNPPVPIPQNVLGSMKMVDFVGYAPNPKEFKGKRYVRKANPSAEARIKGRRRDEPRFRSEKLQEEDEQEEEDETTGDGKVPKYYRKVEIKYSKFGIEDFDFEFYNRTEYSGLETDILNSYTNCLLQALHYTMPIRKVATAHICVDCKKEHCLLCEAGFLFRMLGDARGRNCQASNFSRAFSATSQGKPYALGLMDDTTNPSSSPSYSSLIQNFNRWLLSTFSTESAINDRNFDILRPTNMLESDQDCVTALGELVVQDRPSAIDQLLGVHTQTANTCKNCGHTTLRDTVLHTVDLVYPKKLDLQLTFADLLHYSIVRDSFTKTVCSSCKCFAPLETKRQLQAELPPILSVNTSSAGDILAWWGDQPSRRKDENKTFFPDKMVVREGIEYEVRAMVVQIQDTPDTPTHLVSFAKMPEKDANGQDKWVLFNDFLVRPVPSSEVFSFNDSWKTPSIVILERTDSLQLLDLQRLPKELDSEVLFKDHCISWKRKKNMIKHKVLAKNEMPHQGMLVAIDAEFVALQQEEMEFRSDGTKSILRPSHMSLARVSVLRGEGENEGKPFIDDYIMTNVEVVDYLTEFSGIKPGDLDPNTSPHTLVLLKVAYKKLRLLVDLGCIFVGHGLSKDFRTINIFVPPEQVMDTVLIYTIPSRQRKLSLRFLAWYLLHTDIQTASHDSIEDARYALLLCKLWQDYESEGVFENIMEEMWTEGRRIGFKPPSATASEGTTERPLVPSAFAGGVGEQVVRMQAAQGNTAAQLGIMTPRTPPSTNKLAPPAWTPQQSPSPRR